MVQQNFKIVGNAEKQLPCNIEAEQALLAAAGTPPRMGPLAAQPPWDR